MSNRKNVFYGDKVKLILDERGLTATEIAKQSGVERSMLSAYIHGQRNPKRITVQRLADALGLDISEISGYRKDEWKEVPAPAHAMEDGFESAVLRFIHAEISRQVMNENQSIVSKRIGLSHPQVNRIMNGKADLRLFPIGAVLRLCPQIINRDVLYKECAPDDALAATIERIKMLADRITDQNKAKIIETMLKGVVIE